MFLQTNYRYCTATSTSRSPVAPALTADAGAALVSCFAPKSPHVYCSALMTAPALAEAGQKRTTTSIVELMTKPISAAATALWSFLARSGASVTP